MKHGSPEQTGREEFAEDDRGPPLLADLLESSEKAMHAEITRFQVEQHRRMMVTETQTAAWKQEEMAKGANPLHLDFLTAEHLRKTRETLRRETEDFVEEQRLVRRQRDRMIALFCQQHG